MKKIGFIEDDEHYRQSLRESIHLHPDLCCLIAERSMEAFWEKLPERAKLDVLFIDINLPGMSGIEGLPFLRRRFPEADLIMLTQMEDKELLIQAFTNGATGYLLKDFPVMQLASFIGMLSKGGALISPMMARWLIEYFQPPKPQHTALTTKELQLLQFFSRGYSYQESAELLGLSVDGVKYRVKKIYAKLNVDNKIDAVQALRYHAG